MQAHMNNQQSRKRKKAPLSPNSTFVTIAHIQRARNPEAGQIDSPDESAVCDSSSEAESCIYVGGKPSEISGDSGGGDGGDG
ncbi:hypothetical protein LY78DRAFT_622244, partial [Colletotrichum sublineola]